MHALILVVVAGCGFTPTLVGDGGGGNEGSNTCTTFSSFVQTCDLTNGRDVDLVISGTSTYNTDTNDLRNNGGAMQMLPGTVVGGATGMVRVVVTRNLTINGDLTVSGVFPVAFVAFGDVVIDGHVELSNGGAGSRNDSDCMLIGARGGAGTNDNPNSGAGGGGGGGGAFGGDGGGGCLGDSDGTSAPPGAGGTKLALPTTLAGGCAGGNGGDGETAGTGSSGGKGGGAIAIAAHGMITIGTTGRLAVNGGGGVGGNDNGGGAGGGGSGGLIVLEAAIVVQAGALVANGGGGGEGADNNAGDNGDDGHDDGSAARGGSGNAGEGGNGGDGGAGTVANGVTTVDAKHAGGGGGGGSVGYIAIKSPQSSGGGMFSPPSVPWP